MTETLTMPCDPGDIVYFDNTVMTCMQIPNNTVRNYAWSLIAVDSMGNVIAFSSQNLNSESSDFGILQGGADVDPSDVNSSSGSSVGSNVFLNIAQMSLNTEGGEGPGQVALGFGTDPTALLMNVTLTVEHFDTPLSPYIPSPPAPPPSPPPPPPPPAMNTLADAADAEIESLASVAS
jgi:hypothetical protein